MSARARERSPVRVLIVDHTAALSGAEIAFANMIAHFDRRLVRPTVLLFEDGPLRGRLERDGVRVRTLKGDPKFLATRKDDLGGRSLLKLSAISAAARCVRDVVLEIRRTRAEVVHSHSLKSALIAGVAGRLCGVPVIWHVRDLIETPYLPVRVAWVFGALSRVLPTRVVVDSAAVARTLAGAERPDWLSVVHEGTFRPGPITPPPAGPPRVVLVGRVTPWKGQDVFLRSAALVLKDFPAARFSVVGAALFGETAFEAELRQLAVSLGIAGAVVFTGFRDDVAGLLRQATLVVHASKTGEPFGQVIIEAMAAGRPVVATNGGGVPEIVLPGVTGLLVPMNDVEALATAIVSMLSDPKAAQRMGAAGQQRVRVHFLLEHVAEKVTRLYFAVRRR